MAHFTTSKTWYQGTTPVDAGMFLVQVQQLEESFSLDDPGKQLITDPGREYVSLAHWSGERWDNIIIDECISTDDANPTFIIKAWAHRDIE